MKAAKKEVMFREVIDNYQGVIYRLCCAYVRDEADRQDILQDVLIHTWIGLDRFHGSARLSTWVYRITINTCVTWIRKEQRRGNMLRKAALEQQIRQSTMAWQKAQARRDKIEELETAVSGMGEVDRLLIALYMEGMTSAEIADILGISAGNCRIKIHRIQKQLGRKIGEKYNEF